MTRSTTRRMLAGFMALAALGMVGASVQADPPANPYAGHWFGTWTVAEPVENGTLDLTISNTGRLSGRVFHAQDGDIGWGTVVGHVGADGTLLLIAFAPADSHLHGSGIPHQGKVMIDEEDDLHAVFTGNANGFTVVATLERQ